MTSANDLAITILVDDREVSGLMAEHALSFLIELEGRRFLFDTGQGPALAANSHTLGVDLSTVEALVLSHGHYDHTGGLPFLIDAARNLYIYAHPGIREPRYVIGDGIPKQVGIPGPAAEALDRFPAERLSWVSRPRSLSERLGLTGPIPRETAYEDVGGPFYLDADGTHPDPIVDDLALWVKTDEGLVLVVGCCHSGLINTIRTVRQLSGENRIRAIIGGLHLLNADAGRLEPTLAALREIGPGQLIPCHCTGDAQTAFLAERLGHSVKPGTAGQTYRFALSTPR